MFIKMLVRKSNLIKNTMYHIKVITYRHFLTISLVWYLNFESFDFSTYAFIIFSFTISLINLSGVCSFAGVFCYLAEEFELFN